MRQWLLVLIISACFSAPANADSVKLIPVNVPKPIYPDELSSGGFRGVARVSFTVHSSGKVSDVKVVDSDHPLFSEASIKAVREWRFKPWTVAPERPADVQVLAPMVFTSTSEKLPVDLNNVITKLRCERVNIEVRFRHLHNPKKPLQELTTLSYIPRYLSEGIVSTQLSQPERKALTDEFIRAIPQIIERCEADPKAYYADQLPVGIRALL